MNRVSNACGDIRRKADHLRNELRARSIDQTTKDAVTALAKMVAELSDQVKTLADYSLDDHRRP